MVHPRWRVLGLSTVAFNLAFLVWFSFAPFLSRIAVEFGLSTMETGVLLSAAIWLVPPARLVVGWLADRYGATMMFSAILALAGGANVVGGLSDSYTVFFASRLTAALAGSSFVIGIKHVAELFPTEKIGTAEGIYAGIGNTGAGVGGILLPWLFGTDWRAAFLATGGAAFVMAGVYLLLSDPPDRSICTVAIDRGEWVRIATRYGTIALALGYAMTFGLKLAMDGWLPQYFSAGFDTQYTLAGALAASFSFVSGLSRPFGGYVSDLLAKREYDLLPILGGVPRVQWTLLTFCLVAVGLVAMTGAGLIGSIYGTVTAGVLVGLGCGLGGGAIFAQVPLHYPDQTGSAAGIVSGVGTLGGVVFPIAFSVATVSSSIHTGYLLVAVLVTPVIVLTAWTFRPSNSGQPSSACPGFQKPEE